MLSIIQNEINYMIHDRKLFICMVVFAFYCGTNINMAETSKMSLLEYMISLFANDYYVIYFMFFLFLWIMVSSFRTEKFLILIRSFSIKRFYLCQVIIIITKTILYVALHVIVAFFIGVGRFPYKNKFQINEINGYYNETLERVLELKKYFLSPIRAVLMVILFLIVGFTFCSFLLEVINILMGKKVTLVISGIIILNVMLGFKTNLDCLCEFLFLNNYFIFSPSIFKKGDLNIFINVLVAIASIFFGYYSIKRKVGNKTRKRKQNKGVSYECN